MRAKVMAMVVLGEKPSRPGFRAEAWLMAGAMAASAPFIFNLERANLIWIPVAAIMLFLAWYEAEAKWNRRAALLALSVAIAFKLTPGVFVLLLLKDPLLYLAPVLALSVSHKLPVAEAAFMVLALCALRLPETRGAVRLSVLLADFALFGLLVTGALAIWRRKTDESIKTGF